MNLLSTLERVFIVRPLWFFYSLLARLVWTFDHNAPPVDREYERLGYCQGLAAPEKAASFLGLLENAPLKSFRADDTKPGYAYNEYLRKDAQTLKKESPIFDLGREQLAAIESILREVREPIERRMRSHWRVVNMNCCKTTPDSTEGGGFAGWHTDNFASGIVKCFIYFTGAGVETGTTQVRQKDGSESIIEGPPGTWVLFRVSDRLHRPLHPRRGHRIMLQVTLAPALKADPRPVLAGTNAIYPKIPWA